MKVFLKIRSPNFCTNTENAKKATGRSEHMDPEIHLLSSGTWRAATGSLKVWGLSFTCMSASMRRMYVNQIAARGPGRRQ